MTGALQAKRNTRIFAWAVYGVIFAASLVLFAHPDIVETANHARILLDCIFSGRFLDFYEVVAAHENSFYYINGANYNIALYLVFALWELPVYLVGKIFSVAVGEQFMWLWAKALPALCGVANALLIGRLVRAAGVPENGGEAAWALLLNPLAFFIPTVMGQYETICILAVLLALFFYMRGDMVRFCALMGVAALFKSFALLIVVPMLLLADKKLLPVLRDLALCAAPTLLTGLLFRGRMADAPIFSNEMIGRLFEKTLWERAPVFPLLLAAACVYCWLRRTPEKGRALLKAAADIGLFVFAVFVFTVVWHPQWLYLFVPFWVLSVYLGDNRTPYYYLAPITAAGAFLASWYVAAGHLEANLFYFGALSKDFGAPTILTYLRESVPLYCLALALLYAALGGVLTAYMPFGGRSLADRAADGGVTPVYKNGRLWLWADFVLGCGFWACGVFLCLYFSGTL
ncbi:MAG: hypothetical protein VB021_02850 [Oscillospiraceae bacterium]|nr:hypothetical protein [Oscillospiraceae bacterium]